MCVYGEGGGGLCMSVYAINGNKGVARCKLWRRAEGGGKREAVGVG